MLPTFLRSLFNRPVARLQLQRYHGTAAGWQPIGEPRSAASAERLAAVCGRIWPHRTYRLAAA
jgi:hypothetical protein